MGGLLHLVQRGVPGRAAAPTAYIQSVPRPSSCIMQERVAAPWLVGVRMSLYQEGVYLTCASLYRTFRPLSPTVIITFYLFYLLRFLSHFSLYYLPLIQLTSISVIIHIFAHDYERSATAPSALLHRASGTTCLLTSFLHRHWPFSSGTW